MAAGTIFFQEARRRIRIHILYRLHRDIYAVISFLCFNVASRPAYTHVPQHKIISMKGFTYIYPIQKMHILCDKIM